MPLSPAPLVNGGGAGFTRTGLATILPNPVDVQIYVEHVGHAPPQPSQSRVVLPAAIPRHSTSAEPGCSALQGVVPLELGSLPHLQDAVAVVGYPIGGDTISVTSGARGPPLEE